MTDRFTLYLDGCGAPRYADATGLHEETDWPPRQAGFLAVLGVMDHFDARRYGTGPSCRVTITGRYHRCDSSGLSTHEMRELDADFNPVTWESKGDQGDSIRETYTLQVFEPGTEPPGVHAC